MARLLSVTSMAVLLLWSASAKAAEDVLRLVPRQALGFVVIHHLSDTDAKVQKVAKQVQAPIPSLLAAAKTMSGISKGLDEKGDAALVVMPLKNAGDEKADEKAEEQGDKPDALAAAAETGWAGVLLLPVTDYRAFLDQFHPAKTGEKVTEVSAMGKTALVAGRGDYALLAAPRDRKALEAVLEAKQSIEAEVAGLRPWLAENDVAVVATARTVKLLAAQKIEEARQMKQRFSSMGRRGMDEILAMFDYQEKTCQLISDEVSGVALGVRLDSQGVLQVSNRVCLAPGGTFDQVLAQVGPAQADLLAGLPGGPFAFAAGGVLPKSLVQRVVDIQLDMMKQMRKAYGLSDEQLTQWSEMTRKSVEGVHGFALVLGPSDTLLGNCTALLHVDDATKYLADYEKFVEVNNKLAKEAKKSVLPTIDLEKIDVDGTPALHLETNLARNQRMSGMAEIRVRSANPIAPIEYQSPTIGPKIESQMGPRGWTPQQIDEAIQGGQQIPAINKATGNPAIRYVSPTTGQSVVVDTATGEVIHVGGPGFQYGPGSGDVPLLPSPGR